MSTGSNRRSFVKAAALMAATAASRDRVLGANERLRLGIIGTGGRGTYLMHRVPETAGTQWVAVCDIYDVRRGNAAKLAGPQAVQTDDYRQILDRKDIDAVIIATPDHWHARMAIDACQAGKDIYIEKPMTTHPEDGLKVVKAAREHKRIVQVGVQQRSGPHYIAAKREVMDKGLLGKVGLVRTWYNSNRGFLAPIPPGMDKKPEGLDWKRYLGPLSPIPWDPKRYFNRFAYWDISTGGQIGGLYVHLIDTVHWYLGIDKPAATLAGGGIYYYNDGRDTPDVVNIIAEYSAAISTTFEAEILTAGIDQMAVPTAGMEFRGTGGILTVYRGPWRDGYVFVPNAANSKSSPLRAPYVQTDAQPHLLNWLDCVRTRQRPAADEVSGHYSAVACHMALVSYKEKVRVRWNQAWEVS